MFKPLIRRFSLFCRTYCGRIPFARKIGKRIFGHLLAPRSAENRLPVPSDRGEPPRWMPPSVLNTNREASIKADSQTYVLYRIIGNDLVPRHKKGQALENLRFILDHEPVLERCTKRFIVNRIIDASQEAEIIRVLEAKGFGYQHIRFDPQEYAQVPWDIDGVPSEFAPYTLSFLKLTEAQQQRVLMRIYRHKNNYVMHINGARNRALEEGRGLARWVLPWDGNCFVTKSAWKAILKGTLQHPDYPYHIVPVARVLDNNSLLDPEFKPDAKEEPQIIFRNDSTQFFSDEFFYGRRPKVELLWRLGVPGRWDHWPIEPWDLSFAPYSKDAGGFQHSGWVASLFSEQAQLETTDENAARALRDWDTARNIAIKQMLSRLDDERERMQREGRRACIFLTSAPVSDREAGAPNSNLPTHLRDDLRNRADDALTRGPYSVVDKTTLPPSGNQHDYWHPAPYCWPHPLRLPFLPCVSRDGLRVPGTRLYEPLSDKFDRTRLQRLFDDTYVLVLAYRQLGDSRHAQHARRLVSHWFLENETAMTPHLTYAQVRQGRNGNRGSRSGVIEMKDMYFFLDAVRVLIDEEFLSSAEAALFADWLEQYLQWLLTSEQGLGERAAVNNHGTYYALQVASISNFLGELSTLRDTLRDSRTRLITQLRPDGSQHEELRRTTTAHYCCFNLQGWIHLAELAEHCGADLWSIEGPDHRSLKRSMQWLLGYAGEPWPFQQIIDFDDDRFLPIAHAYDQYYDPGYVERHRMTSAANSKPIFDPHDGIYPFWQLKYAGG